MRILFLILVFFFEAKTYGQLRVLQGTTVQLNTSTKIFFQSVDSLVIEAGAKLINNGELSLPFDYRISEQNGYPIYGTGKEKIPFITTVANTEPGNLGLHLTPITQNDTIFLERYHDTLPFIYNSTKRVFRLSMNNDSVIGARDIRIEADTTEYQGQSLESWHIIGSDTSSFSNHGSDSSGNIYAYLNDTIYIKSLIGLGTFNFTLDSINSSDSICKNDSLFILTEVSGTFNINEPWYAELSDNNGSFSIPSGFDTCFSINNKLSFAFPTINLIQGNAYIVRIKSSESSHINTDISPIVIGDTPPLPLLLISSDTIFCQNYSGGSTYWYNNGILIPGANDSLLIANTDGMYSVEFTSIMGCNSIDSIVYHHNSVIESTLSEFLSIFPNPVENYLIINNKSNLNLGIYDSQGKLVYTQLLKIGENKIDLSNLSISSGLFFVSIDEKQFKLFKL